MSRCISDVERKTKEFCAVSRHVAGPRPDRTLVLAVCLVCVRVDVAAPAPFWPKQHVAEPRHELAPSDLYASFVSQHTTTAMLLSRSQDALMHHASIPKAVLRLATHSSSKKGDQRLHLKAK